MRVLVAGASGTIGTRLVPQLIEAGHGFWTLRYPTWREGFAATYAASARANARTCRVVDPATTART